MGDIRGSRVGSRRELTAQLVLELRVSDLPASIAFYEQAGFILERRTESFAALEIDGRYLLLSEHPGVSAGGNPPNFRLIVRDVRETLREANCIGWRIKYGLADRGYGLLDFTAVDPDGNEVRFASLSAD